MQPGSGSWDLIFWSNAYQGFYRPLSAGIFANASYRLAGKNDRFGENNEAYKFGDEFILSTGLKAALVPFMENTIAIRYRSVEADEFDQSQLPNSGGKWFELEPGANFRLYDQLNLRTSARIPVHRELNGTQLTTSFTFAISIFYTISTGDKDFEI